MDLSGLPDDTLDPGLDLDGLPDNNAKVLREQYRTTTGTPDDAAKVIDLTKRTGLPKPVVERNRQAVERQAFEPDWGDLETSAPITVRELAGNTKLFELAHDDTENMRDFERTLNRRSAGVIGGPAFDRSRGEVKTSRGPEASFSTIVAGQLGVLPNTFERIRQGLRLEIADLFGFETVQQDALRQRQRVDNAEALQTPEFDSTLGRWVYGGASNVQRVVPSIAAGIATRSPTVGLAAMGVQVQPETYGKYRARGGTPGEAALGSGLETGIEIGTEMLPMGFVVDKFGKAGATQFLAGYLGRELPTELVAEITQGIVDTAIANPNKTWGEYVAELPDTIGQTVVSTLMMSGGLTVANEAARRLAGPQAQADAAARDSEALAQISQLAAASKLRARDPQTFQEFVAAANEDGAVQGIYLDARTLQQAGIDPALLAQASPAAAAQLEQALATGGDLVIPVSEYAARIAGTDLDPVLTPHLRTAEDALSLDEAQRFYQGQAEEFQKTAAQVMEERAQDTAWTASAKAVESKLFEELKGTGRFTDDVNTAYSTLMRDFYVATASRLGITPEEMFARYPLQVRAEAVAAEQRMEQGVDTPAFRVWFEGSKVVDAKGSPLVVYHGTASDFVEFRPSRIGELGKGMYFTTSTEEAGGYTGTNERGSNAGKNVMPVYLRLRNPFVVKNNASELWDHVGVEDYDAAQAKLQAEGYDGIAFERPVQKWVDGQGVVDTGERQTHYVVFDPTQIKSAIGNSGEFNPNDPNILKQNPLQRLAQSVMQALGLQQPEAQPAPAQEAAAPVANAGEPLDMTQFFRLYQAENTAGDPNDPATWSITMGQVEQMLERVYGQYRDQLHDDGIYSWRGMLEHPEWADQVGMMAENEYTISDRYLKNLPEDVTADDLIQAYKDKKLRTYLEVKKLPAMQVSPTGATPMAVPYSQKQSGLTEEEAKALWETAVQRPSKKNQEAVLDARYRLFIEHNAGGVIEKLGVDKKEFNAKLKSWSAWTAKATDAHERFNAGREPAQQWWGIPNVAYLSKQAVSAADVDQFVHSVEAPDKSWNTPDGERLRSYILRAFMGIDTGISYKDLSFVVDSTLKPLGLFQGQTRKITIRANSPHTVAHEIGHYLDNKWAREVGNDGGFASELGYVEGIITERTSAEREQWHKRFKEFVKDIGERADLRSDYTQRDVEVFARFVDQFVRWSEAQAGVRSWGESHYDDKFIESDFRRFVTLLQEKAYVDIKDGNPLNPVNDLAPSGQPTNVAEDALAQGNRGEIAFGRDITQTPSVITLFNNADLSTFLHEMGHFQLEVLANIASRPDAPAEIAADMEKVLAWFGIKGDETVQGGETAGQLGQPGDPAFDRWFGDSKVVDAKGAPLTVHHSGSFNENEDGAFNTENGVHFGTKDAALERIVGKVIDDEAMGAEVFEEGGSYYLDENDWPTAPENGFRTEEDARTWVSGEVSENYQPNDYEPDITAVYLSIKNPKRVEDQGQDWSAAIAQAKAEGHDGIVYRNKYEDKGSDSWIVFAPTQIKSVNNRGTYDPNDSNILNQGQGPISPDDIKTNPSDERLVAMLRKSEGKSLRYVVDEAGDFHFWDAYKAIHKDGAEAAGVPYDYTRRGTVVLVDDTYAYFNYADLGVPTESLRRYMVGDKTLFTSGGEEFTGEQMAEILAEESDALLRNLLAQGGDEGVKGELPKRRTALEVWQAMSLEEKRPYHEMFARGFEAYLFEGKAPSQELTGLFSRFRAWLINVYKSVKALNVEISDDIRQVFDRLVATDEAIKQAEAMRSYAPLFKSAEEMGDAEMWAEYQRTGAEATQDAVDGLQRRSLRDMRWLTNARGRILKQLQADAKVKREEVRKEVAREVWSTPTYQAWQFLTSRENLEDVAATPKDVRPDGVDPANDNMMVAVAKLGGLRKDQLVGEWGMDPKERPWSGVFGKPIVRAEGKGITLDEMGLALVDYGYLVADENGLYDAREFEEKFFDGLRGTAHYSNQADYDALLNGPAQPTTDDLRLRNGGRLDTASVRVIVGPEMAAKIEARRMARTGALEPDVVAEMVGFTSGDEMLRTLADAAHPHEMIEGMTDQRVLERYGDLANPDTLARATDEAIHNEARARFVATELKALSKAMTPVRAIAKAAKDFAAATIARKQVKDIKPRQHAAAETRAAKAAEKAMIAGDTATAAVEKRNQLVQNYSTRLSYEALDEIDKAVKYLRKFDSEGTRKNLDTEYVDQIDQLLERFDLRASVSNKAADKRANLLAWVESQRDQGFEPDIPAELLTEALRKPYRELTLEELRGLVDTVKQIEHLGRLKQKLLTAKDEREFKAIRDEIAASIEANAKGTRDLRTRETTGAMLAEAGNRFLAMHRKMASVAREMDGFADGGPMWEYLIRSMNEAGDRETTRRAEATARLYELVKPLVAQGKMGGKGQFFPTLGGSYNREERIAIALNLGNAGNMQRMLDGEGWTMARLQPLLDTITPAEADFVQAVWDFFESYRPEIGAKERRIYGKEPNWVEPQPVTLGGKTLKGGYYPIKYDPARSGRAEAFADAEAAKAQMRGAYTTATTRRSFTKARAEEVTGRPLLYSFAGLYQGTNEVIHDLSWHEWLVDVNRLLRSLDGPIRTHYGAETVGIFKKAIEDIAAGDVPAQNVFERGLNHTRTGATIAGLGWNLMTSLLQPIGLTQSMVRVGPGWVVKGMSQWIKAPLDTLTEINSKSAMMASRAQTMQREINEIQNQVRGSKLDPVRGTFFTLIQKMQMVADVPTWLGAYEKHIAAGEAEARAVALADQAVLDTQGGGQMKDLSQIQRGHPALKLFTNFYSFFNVVYNLGVEQTKQKITQPKLYPSLALDYLLLYVLPSAFVTVMKEAIVGGGDDDEEKLVKKIIADQISYVLGLLVGLREVTAAAQKAAGVEQFKGSYGGPAGLRLFQEIDKLGQQIGQGDADMAAFKAANNVGGILFHYPSGQINRSVEGVAAMVEGKTANPMAVVVGPPKP